MQLDAVGIQEDAWGCRGMRRDAGRYMGDAVGMQGDAGGCMGMQGDAVGMQRDAGGCRGCRGNVVGQVNSSQASNSQGRL